MAKNEEQTGECPLCLDVLEIDDLNFFPCTCGYQICRFCWHRIRTDENGLCPACRKQYPEDPADFKPVSFEEVQRIKNEKKQKDLQRKQKVCDNRKSLAKVRVVQKNLVFVVGLPSRLADADILKKQEYFGKFGKIHKVVVNNCTTYAGSQGPSASAYVTFYKAEDALRALKSVNNIQIDGRYLKASLGTTKYCSHFLKNQQCLKSDCMYLHELGDEAASFTKEEMQQGKHQEYERKLIEQILDLSVSNRKNTQSPTSRSSATEKWPLPSDGPKNSSGKTAIQNSDPGNTDIINNHNSNKIRHYPSEENSCQNGNSKDCTEEQINKNLCNKNQTDYCKTSNKSFVSSLVKESTSERIEKTQYKKDNRCTSNSSSSSRESLFSDSSDGHATSSGSCEVTAKSDSDYETDKTDRESQNDICNIEKQRETINSQSPDFFSTNSSLSTPDGSISERISPFSPSSSPVVTSHLPTWKGQNWLQDEPRMYNMPPGFQVKSSKEINCAFSCTPSVKEIHSVPSDWKRNVNIPNLSGNIPDAKNMENTEFGWGSSQDKLQDDDLGFDPWDVSTKGLADLMKEEAKIISTNFERKSSDISNLNGINSSVYNQSFSQQPRPRPPPGFNPGHISNYNTRLNPNISGNLQNSAYSMLNIPFKKPVMNGMRDVCYPEYTLKSDMTNNFQSHSMSSRAFNSKLNDVQSIKEMQDGFKSLFPANINIKFGSVTAQTARIPPGIINEKGWPDNTSSNCMNPIQHLMEGNIRKYNNYHPYYSSLPSRNQLLPSVQIPPPGFNSSLNLQ